MSFSVKSSIVSTRINPTKLHSSVLTPEKRNKFFGTSTDTTSHSSLDTNYSLIQKLNLKHKILLERNSPLTSELKKSKVGYSDCEIQENKKETSPNIIEKVKKPRALGVKKPLKKKKKVRQTKVNKAEQVKVVKTEKVKVNLDYDYYFERLETKRPNDDYFERMEIVEKWADEKVESDVDDKKENLRALKKSLLDKVSAALMVSLDLHKSKDTHSFTSTAYAISLKDPEFILKLALYSRKHLYLRKISNYLLAYASTNHHCKSFLVKYFNQSVVLPTDWSQVAELSLLLRSQISGNNIAIPPVLRKVMMEKFEEFDEYQLGKYNNAKLTIKNKKGEEIQATTLYKFTLKQMIRKLHINKPVQHVLAILGKRYPGTYEEFSLSKLPGMFDHTLAGKRMRLAIPETWETQLALKGNKAEVWQDLIDHKKLPFMAMLRNLRNLLMSGMSQKHHASIIKRLSDEYSVINSKQLPFRFLSAFAVLEDIVQMKKEAEASCLEIANRNWKDSWMKRNSRSSRGTGTGTGKSGNIQYNRSNRGPLCARVASDSKEGKANEVIRVWLKEKKRKQVCLIDEELIERYKKALNTAISISTTHNITPIPGTTIIFIDFSDSREMNRTILSGNTYGNANSVGSITSLLSLMCERGCERVEVMVVGKKGLTKFTGGSGFILDDVNPLMDMKNKDEGHLSFEQFFDEMIISDQRINNVVFFSTGSVPDFINSLTSATLKYQHLTNNSLNCYDISLHGSPRNDESLSKYWVQIRGCSDQILRFIAENGDSAQMTFVENIDKFYDLKNNPYLLKLKAKSSEANKENIEMPLSLNKVPRWSTCRVFISSTFLDMFSERDLLVRHVFDELRKRGRGLMINVVEVDLRWGITEEEAKRNDTLELCLTEVMKSEFFIGMLGERYGKEWMDYGELGMGDGLGWLTNYPQGASLTELEFQQCFQSLDHKHKAFFYFRNPAFIKEVPPNHRDLLVDDGGKRLKSLKAQVRASGAEVFDNYPCQWGGVNADGQPIMHGLEQFGERVLDNLWNSILQSRADHLNSFKDSDNDEIKDAHSLTSSWVDCLRARFKGRRKLLSECVVDINQHQTGLMLITGKPGSGKSSLMAKLITQWSEEYRSHEVSVVVHSVGAYTGSSDITNLLRYLCVELKNDRAYTPPTNYKSLCLQLIDLLNQHSQSESKRLILFIDGVDQLDNTHDAKSLNWLPEHIPLNVLVVLAVNSYGEMQETLKKRASVVANVEVKELEIADRMEMVRSMFGGHAKKLDETAFNNQMRTLVQKRESSSPMYLSLACEEVRKYGNYEQLSKKLTQLPPTLARLIVEVLERAEEEYGEEFVKVVLCCLYCCRQGLTEDELCHLNTICMQMSPLPVEEINSLAIIINSISYSSSSSSSFHLISSNKVLSFLQSIRNLLKPISLTGHKTEHSVAIENTTFRSTIASRYLSTSKTGLKWFKATHLLLAFHFYSDADPTADHQWTTYNHKSLSQISYHLLQGHDISAWECVMVDWRFVKARFMVGQAKNLMEEFALEDAEFQGMNSTTKKSISALLKKQSFQDYKTFVLKNSHTLSAHPQLLMQQALMEDEDNHVRMDVTKSHSQNSAHLYANPSSQLPTQNTPYFLWTNRKDFKDYCIHTADDIKQVARCMCFNKDYTLLVIGFDDVIIRIYNFHTYQMTKMLIGHSSDVTSLCFVGEYRLCSASKDRTLSLWNALEGYRISVLEGHDRGVSGCVSDRVGRLLVSVGLDGKVVLWHGGTGKLETTLAREKSPINCVAMNPEGRLVIVGLWKGTLHLYDLLERRRSAVFTGHSFSITCVAFDQSGAFVTSADVDGEVRTWNVQHGCMVSQFKGHSLPISNLSFSQHNLLTASHDALIKVSSGKAGKCVGVVRGMAADEGDVEKEETRATCLSIKPDPTPYSFFVVTGYHKGCVKMHSFVPAERQVWSKQLSVDPVAISSISHLKENEGGVLVGRVDGSIFCLDASTGQPGHRFVGATAKVTSIASTTTTAICGCEDKFIYLFDVSSLAPQKTHRNYTESHKLSGHDRAVSGVCVSPSQLLFASVGYDMRLIIWSLEVIGQKVHVIENAHSDWLTCCAWSDDSLVTGSSDFTLRLWQVDGGIETRRMVGHMASVSAVAYQYGCIVSSCTNGEIKVWSHKGVLITSIQAHTQRCNDLALFFDFIKEDVLEEFVVEENKENEENEENEKKKNMIDKEEQNEINKEKGDKREKEGRGEKMQVRGMYVATCSDDASTKLWKPLETDERATLIGHAGGVTSLAVGREGVVCSGGGDQCLKVWRVAKEVEAMAGDTADATVVASHPGQDIVCVAYKNGVLVFWRSSHRVDDEYVSTKFKVSAEKITAMAFIEENQLLVSTADKRTACFLLSNTRSLLTLELQCITKTSQTLTSLCVIDRVDPWDYCALGTYLSGNINTLTLEDSVIRWQRLDKRRKNKSPSPMLHPRCLTTSHSHPEYQIVAGSPYNSSLCFLMEERIAFKFITLMCTKWVCSVAGGDENMVLGDCEGKVWVYSMNAATEIACNNKEGEYLKPRVVFKAHEVGVLSLLVVGDLLVSTSEDLLIKLWTLQDNKQIGQFTCPSPVMAMRVIGKPDKQEAFTILCASKAGCTFFIKWMYSG